MAQEGVSSTEGSRCDDLVHLCVDQCEVHQLSLALGVVWIIRINVVDVFGLPADEDALHSFLVTCLDVQIDTTF